MRASLLVISMKRVVLIGFFLLVSVGCNAEQILLTGVDFAHGGSSEYGSAGATVGSIDEKGLILTGTVGAIFSDSGPDFVDSFPPNSVAVEQGTFNKGNEYFMTAEFGHMVNRWFGLSFEIGGSGQERVRLVQGSDGNYYKSADDYEYHFVGGVNARFLFFKHYLPRIGYETRRGFKIGFDWLF